MPARDTYDFQRKLTSKMCTHIDLAQEINHKPEFSQPLGPALMQAAVTIVCNRSLLTLPYAIEKLSIAQQIS